MTTGPRSRGPFSFSFVIARPRRGRSNPVAALAAPHERRDCFVGLPSVVLLAMTPCFVIARPCKGRSNPVAARAALHERRDCFVGLPSAVLLAMTGEIRVISTPPFLSLRARIASEAIPSRLKVRRCRSPLPAGEGQGEGRPLATSQALACSPALTRSLTPRERELAGPQSTRWWARKALTRELASSGRNAWKKSTALV